MKKEFAPYELAVKLKELGFNEPCFGFYLEDGTWTPASYSREGTVYPSNTDLLPEWCAAPLFQQAFRWFREKHQLYCGILTEYSYGGQLHAYHITGKRQGDVSIGGFNTYEEAELACLTKLIEIVEQKL
jgi:hypothetical protein